MTVIKTFYVYSLIDPINNEIFYVGKGTGSRCKCHLQKSSSKRRSLRTKRIFKIQSKQLQPIINIIHKNLTEQKAFQYEKLYIKIYGRKDIGTGTLCNHTDGGEGAVGMICSFETKQKIAKSNTGKKHNAETLEKLRVSHLGHIHTEEQKKRIGEAVKNRPLNREAIQKTADKNRGKKRTEEQKLRMGLAHKGKKHSEEHNKRISEAGKGRKSSEHSLQLLIKRNRDRVWSIKSREKVSNSLKRYHDGKN